MATQTANLGLKKPDGADYVQVSDFNGNSNILDAIIGKLGELRTEEKSSLVAAINEAMISGGLDSPYVDSTTGHWFTWDNTLLKFIDTGVVAAGGRWYTGTAITGTSSTPTSFDTGITLAQPGDLYLNTVTSYVYLCVTAGNQSTAKWTYLCSIKGNTGEQGLRGLTGAVFTPSVNATTGIISWTNDGGLVNPPSVNIKGQKGDTGNGLNIKGIYASLAALQEAVPSPLAGDMYNIGESAPYRVYMYDANLGWTDIGQIQGPTGPAGKSAYVAAVEAGYSGNEDTFNAQMSAVATHVSDTNNPHGVTKAQVGLGNVDNTSDANKPVSTAQQTAINACKVKKNTLSLPTASWTGSGPYTQTVTITGITVNSKVDIQMDATALGVLIDSGTSAIWIENNNGTLTAKALGEKPNANLSVQVTITEVSA